MSHLLSQSWFLTGSVGLAAFAYAWFIYLPGHRAIAETRERIVQQQQFNDKAKTLDLAMAEAEKQIVEVRKFAAEVRSKLAVEDGLAPFYARLTQEAKDLKIKIVRFEPQPVETFETLAQVPLQMGLEGEFPQIHELLARIEASPDLVWVHTLNITRPKGDSGIVSCEVKLAIFANRSGKSD